MRLLRDVVAAVIIVAVVVLVVREYRSDGGSEAGSDADGGSSLPACADVWVDGSTLPEDYEGCMNEADQIEAPASLDCDSGDATFVTFQDRMFAFLGGPITEAPSSSEAYGRAYEECFADQ